MGPHEMRGPGRRMDSEYVEDVVRLGREADARKLREAAEVIRRRTTRPKTFWPWGIIRVLELNADRLERGDLAR